MNEIILKIRHWLIRKLGGFTEQQIIVQRIDERHIPASPVRVNAFYCFDKEQFHPGSEHDLFQMIKKELSHNLASQLLEVNPSGLVRFECNDDIQMNQVVYRAEICVLSAHDAAMLGV